MTNWGMKIIKRAFMLLKCHSSLRKFEMLQILYSSEEECSKI